MTPRSPQNIGRHELIGLEAEVVRSSHPGYVGMRGVVADETRGMLTLRYGRDRKSVPKSVSTFRFTLPDGSKVEVEGREILGRPEARLRRGRR
jgi:ribonuclease P protein subunit POP4